MVEGLGKQRVALYVAAAVLSALVAVAAFISPAGAWPLAALALACVAAANVDRFSEVSASTSGVKAVLREARTELANLQDVVELMSEFQLGAMQQANRFASNDDEEKASNLKRMVGLMRKAGIPESRISEIKKRVWDRYVIFDYVHSVTGNGTVPDSNDRGIESRWRALRSFDAPAPPEEIERFLNDVGDDSDARRQLLASYRVYHATGEHGDEEAWSKRREVPRVFVRKQ